MAMNYGFKDELIIENGQVFAKMYRYRKGILGKKLDSEFRMSEKDGFDLYTNGGPIHAPDEESRWVIIGAVKKIQIEKVARGIPLDVPQL